MAKKRDVENIRRKNVEDNHRFLEQLRLATARNEFVQTARSIHRNNQSNPIKKTYQKIERSTRYNEKVKAGEIPPFVPEWQRLKEEKKIEAEKRLLEKQQRVLQQQQRNEERLFERELNKIERQLKYEERRRIKLTNQVPVNWGLEYITYSNERPYERVFKPRKTRTSERIEYEITNLLKKK